MPFIDDESPQKLRGGYYTPPDIAAFLARWALGAGAGPVLEPSCGDGVFLRALEQVGPPAGPVWACEADGGEAEAAGRSAGSLDLKLHVGDFLEWALARAQGAEGFAAVVGNPPYIRYQYLPRELQDRAAALIQGHGLRFTRHTNAWVPFVVAAVALLRPGGRLAMVVPAELLHVLHAQSLRDFLLQECSAVSILDPEELWFGQTLQGTVLLLAERRQEGQSRGGLAIAGVRGRAFLAEPAEAVLEGLARTPPRALEGKWMRALLGSRVQSLLDGLDENPLVHAFSSVADVSVGIVTGANKFFLVPAATVAAHELEPWARPMFGRSEHVPGVVYDAEQHAQNVEQGLPSCFLDFNGTTIASLPPGPRAYVRQGEAQGLHRRYKCRIRSPWIAVPSVSSAPVAMLKRSHDHPRLVRNALGALTTDTAYRVRPRQTAADRLVACFVNGLTVLCAELEGRHYGGGVLELVPSEIRKLRLPLPEAPPEALGRLDDWFREGVGSEEILVRQDAWVLGGLGLSAADALRLREAWAALRRRRQRSRS